MNQNSKSICINCNKCTQENINDGCVIDQMALVPIKYPTFDDKYNTCPWFDKKNVDNDISINHEAIMIENKQEIKFVNNNKDNLSNMENYQPHVDIIESSEKQEPVLSDEEYKLAVELFHNKDKDVYTTNKIYEKLGLNYDELFEHYKKIKEEKDKEINSPEDMLKGDITISHIKQVTTWQRVLNAARRTIGKEPLEKEPSNSWKAKILLAEHSPIRLLEYDFGWKNIRQWVSVHLVRHHEGVEKFVHSQRGDRRELPCDRDHIYQGARNDMDMSANAQAIINMSRKRLCNCASKETREAWQVFMNELEKIDPILRSKCVPECIYRGFCPEWMNCCGYSKTNKYKMDLAKYRSTKFGKDIKYYCLKNLDIIVSNTGYVYEIPQDLEINNGEINIDNPSKLKEVKYDIRQYTNGNELCIIEPIIPVASLVIACFSKNPLYQNERIINGPLIMPKGEIITHIDGNMFNNDIDNLKTNGEY